MFFTKDEKVDLKLTGFFPTRISIKIDWIMTIRTLLQKGEVEVHLAIFPEFSTRVVSG